MREYTASWFTIGLGVVSGLGCQKPAPPEAEPAASAEAPPSAQEQIDRTVLPIVPPEYPPSTELDARDAKVPPPFEVKAPEGAPNVVVVLIDDIGFGATVPFGGVIIAQGGKFGGWALYMDQGKPTYTYNWFGLDSYTVLAMFSADETADVGTDEGTQVAPTFTSIEDSEFTWERSSDEAVYGAGGGDHCVVDPVDVEARAVVDIVGANAMLRPLAKSSGDRRVHWKPTRANPPRSHQCEAQDSNLHALGTLEPERTCSLPPGPARNWQLL